MIAVTFRGASAWLIPFAPDWTEPVVLTARVATETMRSLTGREIRQTLGASLRCALRWHTTLAPSDIAALRNALVGYVDERVLVPVWPFAVRGADWPGVVSGGVLLGWMEGFSSYALDPVTPSAWDWVAPVIVGRWASPDPELWSTEVSMVEFFLEEDVEADYGLAPAAVSWTGGPALNDATVPKVFPFALDWSDHPRSGLPAVEVTRRAIGDAPRMKAAELYPQSGALTIEGAVTLDGSAAIATLLRWWQDTRADVVAHYVFLPGVAATLSVDAAAGATTVTLTDATLLGAYRYLALSDASGRIEYARITTIAGNVCTLGSALAAAWSARGTVVSVAALARHAVDALELRFDTPDVSGARLSWTEVREEYVIADLAEEARGVTVGSLPLRAWLYRVTVDRVGSSATYRLTSYERSITVGADTWVAAPVNHGELMQSLRLERDEVTFSSRWDNTWCNEFLPGRLTARVLLEILECDVSGGTGSNVAARWTGEIVKVSSEGPFVKASARGPYSAFDRPCPRFAMQAGCNHALFDGQCGLTRSQWEFSAVVSSVSGAQVTLGSWARVDAGALPSGFGFAHWFALGYVERSGTRLSVVSSTALSSGLITLTLDRVPATAFTVGLSVVVVPGCDGRPESCKAWHTSSNPQGRFNNWPRFGGFPEIPEKNPAFTGLKKTNSAHGKK